MKQYNKSYLLILIALMSFSTFCQGQITNDDIILGQRASLESKILGETRNFFIYLPEGYGQSNESYPVMYVLDAETNFTISAAIANFSSRNQQIPQMIVVGIPNIDRASRNRDFTPTVDDRMQNSGGADNFLEFLDRELIKYMDDTYRTQDYKILFGHSLCGMFSVYTLFTNPDLFNAHIAASPYLMMSDEYVIKKAKDISSNNPSITNQLYLSIGNEPDYFKSLDKLSSVLKSNKVGVNWTLEKYLEENHGSVPIRTIVDGLAFIFSNWQLTNDIATKGVGAIKNHIKNRYEKYGFSTQLNEITLNAVGYQLLQADNIVKAIGVFEYNVELYPFSANVYDSLGDAYDAKGNKEKAKNCYIKAVSIGEENNDPNLPAYKNNLERLEGK